MRRCLSRTRVKPEVLPTFRSRTLNTKYLNFFLSCFEFLLEFLDSTRISTRIASRSLSLARSLSFVVPRPLRWCLLLAPWLPGCNTDVLLLVPIRPRNDSRYPRLGRTTAKLHSYGFRTSLTSQYPPGSLLTDLKCPQWGVPSPPNPSLVPRRSCVWRIYSGA